jgi:type II secretory pathway pseudopilin PulG
MRIKTAAGFSLVELVIVVGMAAAVTGISVPALMTLVADARSDSATTTVVSTMRTARDRAIGERRNFEVRFIPPNQIQIARVELADGADEDALADITIVSNTYLEGNFEFLHVEGTGDTPDEYGAEGAVAFGTSPTRMFTSEGTFVNTIGDPLNGTIFLAAGGIPNSSRAITILGASALIHSWRWDGRAWVD